MSSLMERKFFDFFTSTKMDAFYLIGVGPKTEWLEYKSRYPEGRLYGCEPHPESYKQIKGTFKGDLYNLAIDEVAGEIDFHLSKVPMQSSMFRHKSSVGEPIKVSTITLDQFDQQCGKQDNITLWMDIEGAEYRALKGAPELLSSGRVKIINMEITDVPKTPDWCSAGDLDDILKGYGYSVFKYYNEQRTHRDVIYVKD